MSFDSKQHYNDKRAANYDVMIRKAIPGYDTLHAMSRVLLETEVGDQAHLLVAGCGTGTELDLYARECLGWRFTGVDPSKDMLNIARGQVEGQGRVEWVEGYVSDLAQSPMFDAATLILVMHFLPDDVNAPGGGKAGVLQHIAQRLKPGAPLILADMHAETTGARFQRFLGVWRQWQLKAGIPEKEVEKGFRKVIDDISFIPEQRIIELLHQNGFGTVEPFFGSYLLGGWIAWRDDVV